MISPVLSFLTDTSYSLINMYRGISPINLLAKNSNEANHVVFYDQMKIAKSCKKINLKKLGYSCKDLESQELKFVHTIK